LQNKSLHLQISKIVMQTTQKQSLNAEKRLIIRSAIWPLVFVAVMWVVKLLEIALNISLSEYGMAPRSLQGLYGIFTYPFLHKDLGHLTSNSLPLLFLGTALFYYYRDVSRTVFFQLFIISGLWLLILGKQGSIHIGASGLVYGLTAFHITAGLIKRNKHLLAFALLVMFLYGSMVWGVFPDFFPKRNISWEGHLTGMLAGVLLAWFHRDKGPQRDRYEWEDEEEENDDELEEKNKEDALLAKRTDTLNWGGPYKSNHT
jgi:membrane associated rhomboid family serine protease